VSVSGKDILIAVKYVLTGASDLLFPRACGSCGSPEVSIDGMCASCGRELLSLVALPYCPRCGATIGPNIPIREDGCSACPSTLPRFRTVVRLGPYTHPLRSAIQHLKYHRREDLLERIGQLLTEAIAARIGTESLDVVMGVPMHWRRRLVRGYDHARIIARQIAKRLDLPLGDELIRIRHTPPQVRLPRSKRIQVIRGAFGVRSKATIQGARVLLVDDVTTTGATANEAAKTLLRAGASKVILAVICKAEPPTAYTAHLE